jgi:hypothetical protein
MSVYTQAISGFGVTFKQGDGEDPEVFASIAEVKGISGPGYSLDMIDVTHLNSPGGFREFIGGLIDGGEITFDINFIPSNPTHNPATGLLADLLGRRRRNYQLGFPTTPVVLWVIPGQVTNIDHDQPLEDAITASVTIKIVGLPTFV